MCERWLVSVLFGALAIAGCASGSVDPVVDGEPDPGGGKADGVAPLTYHGGPMMTGPVTVHLIYYGDWSGNTATEIIPELISWIGSSPWYQIVTQYTDGDRNHPSSVVETGSSITLDAPTNYLSNIGVWRAVSNAIDDGSLPEDDTAVYLLLSARGIIQREKDDCGWHDHHKSSNGLDIKYAWVGDFGDDSGCNGQPDLTVSPNENPGADQMATNAMHELVETITDPHQDAWTDADGNENGDKCINTYGKTFKTPNGAIANMTLGGRSYLIQRNWSVVTPRGCRLGL